MGVTGKIEQDYWRQIGHISALGLGLLRVGRQTPKNFKKIFQAFFVKGKVFRQLDF